VADEPSVTVPTERLREMVDIASRLLREGVEDIEIDGLALGLILAEAIPHALNGTREEMAAVYARVREVVLEDPGVSIEVDALLVRRACLLVLNVRRRAAGGA
jgi:hypothetical protein